MFGMIRHTHQVAPQHTVVAYSDNASVMEGDAVERLLPQGYTNAPRLRRARRDARHVLMKVETHNHPTAISPFPGASTGAGGEIRDEGATGRGSKPKAGLTGFTVSNLWGTASRGSAARQARAHRQPAADHDRGPAGRRRVQQRVRPAQPAGLLPRVRAGRRPACARGYHKPIMIAGGLGTIDAGQTQKIEFPAGTLLVQLGGPGHAHRHGRRRRQFDGHRRQRGGARLRLGAARQPRDRAARAGSHQPLLGAGRAQPDPGDPRRGRRRPVQRLSRADQRRRPRRPLRPAQGAAGRIRPGAQGNLVQRKPGALCAGDRAGVAGAVPRPSASASAARSRWSAWRPRSGSWCSTTAPAASAPVDMPMDVLLGKPPKMHRDVQRVARAAARRST